MVPIFSLYTNATPVRHQFDFFFAKALSLSLSFSSLPQFRSKHFGGHAHWKRLSFKQNPSSSSILFYMPFRVLSEIPAAGAEKRHIFVSRSSMNALAVTLDRHFHFHFEIFCFASFFHSLFLLSPHFYFDFCPVLCVILKSTANKELLLIHAKSLCVYKSVMRTKVNT